MKKGNLLNRFKRFNRINRLFLILAAVIAGSGNVWADSKYYAKLVAYTNPSGKGYVYVGTKSESVTPTLVNDEAKIEDIKSGGSATFYLTALETSGYSFVNWTGTNPTYSSIVKSNAQYTISNLSSDVSCDVTANFAAKKYNLYLDFKGGTIGTTTYLEIKSTAEKPLTYDDGNNNGLAGWGVPSRTGYAFTGYYDADGVKAYNADGSCNNDSKYWSESAYKHDGDLTADARWTANTYTVTFAPEGGTVSTTSKSVTYDATYGVLPTPTRTGYEFNGWFTAASGGTQVTSSTKVQITADQTLHAHWTVQSYEVTLDQQSGSGGTTSVTATYDADMPSGKTKPSRTGYTFQGYFSETNGGGTEYYNADMLSARTWNIASNTTLYAYWMGNQYTVTFNRNGGTGGSDNVSVIYGSAMQSATAPTRAGFTFQGYIDANGVKYYDQNMQSVRAWDKTSGATLYAQWHAYQLNYNLNYEGANQTNYFTGWNGTVKSESLDMTYDPATGIITANGTLSKSNATMIWQTLPDMGVGDNLSMAVQWIQGTRSTDNGSFILDLRKINQSAFDPAIQLGFKSGSTNVTGKTIPSGYHQTAFWYWLATKDNKNPITLTNNQFKLRIEKSATLGSVASPSGKYIIKGQAYGKLANDPERATYRFDGWYTSASDGAKIESTTTFNGDANQVLYAHWTPYYYAAAVANADPNDKGVVWVSLDGSWPSGASACGSTASVTKDEPSATANPKLSANYQAFVNEGYGFDGWYTSANGAGTKQSDKLTYTEEFTVSSRNASSRTTITRYAHFVPVTVNAAMAQTVDFTGRTETKTATLEFIVANASSANDFNAPTVSGDAGWTVKSWSYANNKVSVVMTFTATENTTPSGNHVATVTLKAKSNNSNTGKVTANVNMVPAYTNSIKSSYLVEETTLDLNALWTSTSTATKTYTITEFTPEGSTTGGTTPTISNNTIALTQSGTLKLKLTQPAGTSGPGGEQTCTVIINKRDNAITTTYSGTMFMGATQDVTVSATNTATPITFTQTSGSDIATLNSAKNQVTSYANLGTATWTFSQAENYKYKKPTDATMSIVVKKADEVMCYVIDKGEIEYDAKLGNHTDKVEWSEDNVAATLYFNAKRQSGSVSDGIQPKQKVNNEYVNVGSEITDQSTEYKPYSVPLNQTARGVRFYITGSYNNYVKNVRVSRKTFLLPTENIVIDQKEGSPIYIGESSSGTLHVDWSICNGGTLNIASSNPKFTLSQTSISEATDGSSGSKDITVYYQSADAGTDVGTIVVYNDVYRAETQVTGVTVKKTPTMEWWTMEDPTTLSTLDGAIVNPVIVSTEGCDYTLTMDKAGYLTFDSQTKTLTPNAATPDGQYVELTATIDNHDYYKQITKKVAVTNLMSQTITWTQSFNKLLVTDPVSTMHIEASAINEISYTSSDPTVVSVDGTTLTILKKGTCTLTAKAAKGNGYAEAVMNKQVIVRNLNDNCEPQEVFNGTKFNKNNPAIIYVPFPSKKLEVRLVRGDASGSQNAVLTEYYYVNGILTPHEIWHGTLPAGADGYNYSWNINSSTVYVAFTNSTDNKMKLDNGRWTMAQYLNASTNSLSVDATTTESKEFSFDVYYSNIQAPLVYTSDNSFLKLTPESGTIGDCGEDGTQTITVTYAPAEVQNGDYTITIWDGKTESLKKTITVHCVATAVDQTMNWTQDFSAKKKTTDAITFDATTNANKDYGTFPVVYTSSNESVATIDGNKLNILSSGTVTITASQDGKDANGRQRYNAVSATKTITIEKVTPDIKTLPTVGAVKYGEKYSKYTLSGGAAETTYQGTAHTAVSGTFGWTTPDAQITTKDNLSVTFVPSNTGLYNNKVVTINAPSISNVVTFDPNQGSVTPTTKEVTYNSTYGELPTPTRYGYIFAGWFIDDNEITASSTVATMADHTLTAHWTAKKYNLRLEYNNGTGQYYQVLSTNNPSLEYNSSSFNDVSWTLPSYLGHTLKGFFDANDVQAYDGSGHSVVGKYWDSNKNYINDGDLSTTAHWDANTYYVQFDGNGNTGGSMSNQQFTYDQAQNLTTNAYTKTGYTFDGWSEVRNGAVVYSNGQNVSNLIATKDSTMILYAHWTITPYTVTFNLNGGSSAQPDPITVYYGQTYGTLPTPTHASKKFLGWYLGDQHIQSTTTVTTTSDHTLKAHWDDACYVISFNANGGTGEMSNMIVGMEEEITVPANGFTAPSYTLTYDWNDGTGTTKESAAVEFAGWEDHGSIVDYEGTTWTYTQFDGPFYANTYSDLYNTFGYNKKSLINHYVENTIHGSETRQCTGDPRGAYKVGGKNLSNLSTTNQTTVPLYAQWRKDVTLPSRVRTGYDFNGWFDGDTKVGDGGATYPFMSTKTLTAHWTAHRYCVWFEPNGEGATRSKDSIWVTHGEKYGTLATATRYGYNFEGWYTQKEGGDLITSESIVNLSTETNYLYAHWSPITYTVSYNANGGTGSIASQNMTYNTDAQLTAFTGQMTAPTIEHTLILDAGEGYIGSTHTSSVKANNAVFGGWEDHGSIVFSDTTYVNPVNPSVDPSGTNVLFFDAAAYGTNNSDVFALVKNKYDKYGLVSHYRNYGLCECQGTCGYNAKRCQDWQGEPGAYPDQAPVLNMTGEQGYTVPLYAHWVYTFDLPIPTRENYSFVGWYDRDKLVTKEDVVHTSRDQLTLTAHWVPNYTVHFDGNGATSAQLDDQIYNYDEQLNLPTSPTREHTVTYKGEGTWTEQTDKVTGTLLGWEDPTPATYTDELYTKSIRFAAVAGADIDSVFDAAWYGTQNLDVRTHAQYGEGIYDKGLLFKHYLYYVQEEGRKPYSTDSVGYYPLKSDDGTGVMTTTYVRNLTNIPGQLVTLKAHWKIDSVTLPVATRTGYQLAGWSDGTTTYVEKFLPKDKKEIELTSQWNANTYYVQFNSNGGSGSMDNQEFTYDAAAKALTLNTYGRAYTVSFNADGGAACSDQTATYTFKNWNTNAEGTGTTYTNGQAVQNLTSENEGIFPLYAQWNTGSVTLPSTTKTGYSLTGWSDGSKTYAAGAQYTPSADITLTAVWGALAYTVTFDKQQGTGGSDNVSATFNAAMPSATAPSRTGYTFQGYFAAAGGSGTKYYNADMTSAHVWDKAAATTLYAHWTANSYTVTFNGVKDGATVSPASQSVTYDAKYGTLATASHPSNRFDGWFTQATGGTEVTAETVCKVADNHSIYAHWTQLYYSQAKAIVSAKGCSGVYVTIDNVTTAPKWLTPNDQTNQPVELTTATDHIYYYFANPKEGYTLTGWSVTDGGTKIDGSTPDANLRWKFNGTVNSTTTTNANPQWFTYYPVMTPNQYEVTFDKQSGTGGSDNVTATYDAAMPSGLTAPTRAGYTFAGYYDAVSGGTQYYTAAMASAHIWNKAAATTLYARWTAKQYTVTLNPNYTGAATKNVTATYGSAMPSMGDVPTRTGHKFTGYYDAQDGGTQYYKETGASARTYDKTSGCILYAHWIGADFFTWNNSEALTFEATTTIPNSVAVAFSGHNVTYTSGNSSIVEVQANGTLLAKKAGSVSITATTAEDPSGYFAVISETKTFTITKTKQSIVWEQNFAGLQTGDEPITLTAYAIDTLGNPNGANISYAVANTSVAKVENGQIVVVGKGETTITATATSEVYRDTTKTLKVVVRTLHEPCNTTVYDLTNTTTTVDATPYEVELNGVPYDSVSIKIKKTAVSWISTVAIVAYDVNGGTHNIQTYSQDDVTTTLTEYKIALDIDVPLTKLTITRTSGVIPWTIGDIKVKQSSYLNVMQDSEEGGKLTKISTEWTISTPFDTTFLINFCDKPVISARVTNHNGLKLTRKESAELGGCGAYDTYHYTLSSTHTWSETGVILRDTIFITDGMKADSTAIPIALEMKTGKGYYFKNTTKDHLWSTISNWETAEGVPTKLPTAINPVTILDTVIITDTVEVYAMTLEHKSYAHHYSNIIIEPTGGLSIYKSIYYGELSGHLLVKSSLDHTGYFRVAPMGVKAWSEKPRFTMQYATKATLDNGANKDAKWQYFGIPVDNYDFTVDYITWLNEWDETNSKGWIKHNNESKPVNMKAFRGYEITQYGQPVYEFTGAIRMDSVTLTLTNTASGKHGDNIIANSFPAPIDVTLFTDDDFSEGVEKTFYIYNSGSWNQWKQHQDSNTWQSDAPGAFTVIPIKSADLLGTEVQTLIPPMQAMCMYTEKAGTVKLNYAKHVWYAATHSSKDDMNAGLRAPSRVVEDTVQMTEAELEVAREKAIRDSLARASKEREKTLTHRARITFTSENSGADHVYLLERNGFTSDFENGYDAYKMWGSNSSALNTYAGIDLDNLMSVWATDNLVGTYVGIDAGEDATYCLRISSVIGDSLYLKDLTNDVEIDIADGQTYMFNAEPGTYNEQRFIVMKHQPTTPTEINEHHNASNAYIWTDAHYLHIENAGNNSALALYAADGKLLYSETIHRRVDISIDQLAQSMYMVYVDGKPFKFVKK